MPKRLNKICVICGDKASGFNFNAITCESCKAFFRRNATKSKQFQCFLGGKCQINLSCRKYCKKCRLNKCFDIGMRKELILSDQQKEVRRKKIQEKKIKKQEILDELTKLVDQTLNQTSPEVASSSDNSNSNSKIDLFDTNSVDSSDQSLSRVPVDTDQQVICRYFDNMDTTGIAYDTYRTVAELEFAMIPIPRTVTTDTFNELEGHRLTELFEAIKVLHNRPAGARSLVNEFTEVIAAMNDKSDYDIRNIVKMSKRLLAFGRLCESDKIYLLKYSAIEIIALRVVPDFDPESSQWTAVTNSDISKVIYMNLLREGKRNYYQNYEQFLSKILPEWNSDTIIIDLLTAIILFDSTRPKLTHRESVKLQQQVYLYLLQRYLHLKYQSDCVSDTKFLKLLNSLRDLHIVSDKIALNWIEGDPKRILPLLKEIGNRNSYTQL